MYLVEIKEQMQTYLDENKCGQQPTSISEYICKVLLPYGPDADYYDEDGFLYHPTKHSWVIIVTDYHTYRVHRNRISAYTNYDNDCLELRINKGVTIYIRVQDLVAIEYEKGGI